MPRQRPVENGLIRLINLMVLYLLTIGLVLFKILVIHQLKYRRSHWYKRAKEKGILSYFDVEKHHLGLIFLSFHWSKVGTKVHRQQKISEKWSSKQNFMMKLSQSGDMFFLFTHRSLDFTCCCNWNSKMFLVNKPIALTIVSFFKFISCNSKTQISIFN